ncbi:MAG: hypothetical protein AAGD01_18415 [Acidobacteriota bacterium]
MAGVPNQAFLDTVGEQVDKAANLTKFFICNENRVVPSSPERSLPVDENPELACEIAVREGHEVSESTRIRSPEQYMVMVGEEDDVVDLDGGVVSLSLVEHTDSNASEARGRSKEQTPLESAAGHFDHGAAWRKKANI